MSDKVKETDGQAGFPEHAIMLWFGPTDHDPACANIALACLCKWVARTCVCRWAGKADGGWKGAPDRAQAALGDAAVKHLMHTRFSR